MDRELSLGTLFKGDVDQSFRNAINQLKSSILELGNLQRRMSSYSTKGKGITLQQEMSQYAKTLGNATNESTKYQTALARILSQTDKTNMAIRSEVGALNAAEKSIQSHARAIRSTISLGERRFEIANKYVEAADREALVHLRAQKSNLQATAAMRESGKAAQSAGEKMQVAAAGNQQLAASTIHAKQGISGLHADVARATGAFERFSRALKVVLAYSAAGGAFYALQAAVRGTATEIMGFDQNLKSMEAITQATTAQIGVMGEKIKEIGRDTAIGPKEAANAMTLLGQAGLEADEVINAVKATTTLATGAIADMTATADLMSTALMAFNLNATESSRVADVMANAMNKSKLDVDKLRTAFNYVGASSAEAGLTLEQSAASMMVLSNAGLRASTIGTGLRQVLAKLINPNEKLRETYESHGIALEKINPVTIGWSEALKNLSAILWDHEKGIVNMSRAYKIFELRGAQAAAVLVRAHQSGDYQKMLDYTFAVGSANEMAGKQMEGLSNKAVNLVNNLKLAAINLGEGGLAGSLRVSIDLLRSLVDVLNTFLGSTGGRFTVQVLGMTAVVLGLTKAMKLLFASLAASQGMGTFIAGVRMLSLVSGPAIASLEALRFGLAGLGRILLGPAGIVLAIASAITWIYRMVTANERLIQQSNEQIVKYEAVVSSLESYEGALQSLEEREKAGQEVQTEKIGLLQRLISEHKELAQFVDINTASYNDLYEALRGVLSLKFQEQSSQFAASLIAQSEGIKSLTRLSGAYVDEYGRVIQLQKESEERSEKIKKATIAQTATQDLWVLSLKRSILAGDRSLEQAEEMVRTTLGFSEAGREMADVIVNKLNTALAAYYGAMTKGAGQTAAEVKGMPEKFRDLYNSLTDLQKFEFLGDYKSLKSKIAQIKKEFADSGLTGDVNKAIGEAENQWLEDFKRKISKVKAIASAELKYDALIAQFQTDRQAKIEAEYQENLAKIEKFKQQEYDIVKNSADKQAELENRVSTLSSEAEKKRDYDLAQLAMEIAEDKIDLTKLVAMTQVEIAKRGAAEESQTRIEAQEKEAEIVVKALREIAAEREKLYRATSALFGEDDTRTIEAKKKSADAQLAIEKAITEGSKTEIDRRLKYDLDMTKRHLLEKYRAGKVSDMIFLEESKKLLDARVLDEEEYARRVKAVEGSTFDQIRYGLEQSQEQVRTWGEHWIDMGEKVSFTVAGEMSNSLMDFIEGTKNAKEAFSDFARSTLSWITEMIVKQTILNAVMGIVRSFSAPAQSAVTSGFASAATYNAEYLHDGGKVGEGGGGVRREVPSWLFFNAPRLHSGLRYGEYPAILEKGEEVISKADVRKGTGMNVQVVVNNNTGTKAKVRQDPPKFNGKEWVVSVWLDAYEHNEYGIRDLMGG